MRSGNILLRKQFVSWRLYVVFEKPFLQLWFKIKNAIYDTVPSFNLYTYVCPCSKRYYIVSVYTTYRCDFDSIDKNNNKK